MGNYEVITYLPTYLPTCVPASHPHRRPLWAHLARHDAVVVALLPGPQLLQHAVELSLLKPRSVFLPANRTFFLCRCGAQYRPLWLPAPRRC